MSGAAIILFLTWAVVELLAYYDPQAEARERKEKRQQMQRRDPSPTPLPKKKGESEPFGNPEQLDFDLDPELIRKQERIKREIEAKKKLIDNIKLEIN